MVQPKKHLAPVSGGTPPKAMPPAPMTAGAPTVPNARMISKVTTPVSIGRLKPHLAPAASKGRHPRPAPSVVPNQATSYAGGPAAYTSGSGMRSKGK